ncbi:hypothetical protein EJ357_46820 [Streptomyces cyaneochromogenes]|uniref:Transposase IS204/IS1001/IS1096/IS1165 DDE domain-containing protein n=1 Tax=Streptomyces cyaneochromogenes TaxID=2496836 RepID=A0A3S9MLC3_9ACTN|nr:hypothetical protein EJ357_46820 [Streptomyces cyaneochromogenes]
MARPQPGPVAPGLQDRSTRGALRHASGDAWGPPSAGPEPHGAAAHDRQQVAGLTESRHRSSQAARSAMRAVAMDLGGRPGQRLCAKLRLPGRRSALLSQLVAPPVPAQAPRVLGIDEFAFRKGRTYGTVLVDVVTFRPVDVLPDRETYSVAAWLQEHPGAEIVCRDRLMALTKAIRQAAPGALEVADRRHLLPNLSTAVEKMCRRHRACLRRHATTETGPPSARPQRVPFWIACANATETLTNWPPRGCPSAPSAAACNWTARRYGAIGTVALTTSSPRRATGAQVYSTRSPTTCSTASGPVVRVPCSSTASCLRSALPRREPLRVHHPRWPPQPAANSWLPAAGENWCSCPCSPAPRRTALRTGTLPGLRRRRSWRPPLRFRTTATTWRRTLS